MLSLGTFPLYQHKLNETHEKDIFLWDEEMWQSVQRTTTIELSGFKIPQRARGLTFFPSPSLKVSTCIAGPQVQPSWAWLPGAGSALTPGHIVALKERAKKVLQPAPLTPSLALGPHLRYIPVMPSAVVDRQIPPIPK